MWVKLIKDYATTQLFATNRHLAGKPVDRTVREVVNFLAKNQYINFLHCVEVT